MNRIIVVTGGAAGIGRCTVEYFASKGDRIYFIDNNQEATLALTERMHRKGLNVTGYTGDIAEKQSSGRFCQTGARRTASRHSLPYQ